MDAFTQGDLLGLASVYSYVLWVMVVAWVLKGRVRNLRKIVHVLTGGIVFFWWMFDSRIVMAGLAAFPFVLLLLLATPRSPFKFLRDGPLGTRSSEGHPYGLVLYAVSWTVIAYVLFDDLVAASVAIAAMAFGDGMGEVIGRRYGKHEYMPHRTLEGSTAVFLATTISIMVLSWFYFDFIRYTGGSPAELLILFAPVTALLVCILEAVTPGSIDNLVLPIVVAGFLHVVGV